MKKVAVLLLAVLCGLVPRAQYTVNGNATQISCNEYRLTDAIATQSGSVWNNNKIDLTQSFDFKFDVFLGSKDADGADGIVFVLQPISTSVGSSGGGLGYENITPAAGITIDTYQNGNNSDPVYDHIAIQLNGDISHTTPNNIAGPVTAISGNDNIEDGQWHALRVVWDAPTFKLTAYIDGVLRVSANKDLVTDVFSGNPMVYWGFTGSTGGLNNYQGFKIALNPLFHLLPNQKRCLNVPVQFIDSTVSFTNIVKFYWDFGDGSPIDSVNLNPVHTYSVPNDYVVKHRAIGADGCEAVTQQTIRIGSKPVAGFSYADSCIGNSISFHDTSSVTVGTLNNWYWDFGNGNTSTQQHPVSSYVTGGTKTIRLAVKSLEGCESDTLVKTIHIYTPPGISFSFTDSVCIGSPTFFNALVTAAPDPVTNWSWTIDGQNFTSANPNYIFPDAGPHTVGLSATSNNSWACSTTVQKTVFVAARPVAACREVRICQQAPVQLSDSSYSPDGIPVTQWWWDLGNGQFSVQQNPQTVYSTDGPVRVKLVVGNARGCYSDTLYRDFIVHAKPQARFGYLNRLCGNEPVQFLDSSWVNNAAVVQWSWIYNGQTFSSDPQPVYSFPAGPQTVGLLVTSSWGCVSDTTNHSFFIQNKPVISMHFSNACKGESVPFTATETTGTAVGAWSWSFGDGGSGSGAAVQHTYTDAGTYLVRLSAVSTFGCTANLNRRSITIYDSHANAGADSLTAAGQPVQLHGSGGISYLWSPAALLNNATIANPIALIDHDQTFLLKAFTPEGCESYDEVTIKVYKGPDIYLPNAFTPNHDGRNDVYRGIPVGIAQFGYLAVYNRFGQQLFYTSNYRNGWDGSWKGQEQENGTYVVIAYGIDFRGQPVHKKQSFILLH
ncbi:MAG: PKD domain-containing protein [Ferruginibacter sp.]